MSQPFLRPIIAVRFTGASANNNMAHIAIQEALNGRVAEWLEKVSNEDYGLTMDG